MMRKDKCTFTMTTYNERGSVDNVVSFGVARIPGRKQMALFIGEGVTITPVAYFKDDSHAELFHHIFNVWNQESFRMK